MTRPPLSTVDAINKLPRERAPKLALGHQCRQGCPLPYPLLERTLCYHCGHYRTGDEQVMLLPAPDPARCTNHQPIGTTVTTLIAALASRGITLRLADDGTTLLAKPRAMVTLEIAQAIRAHKLSLIVRYKAAQPLPPEPWHEGMAESLVADFEYAYAAWATRDRAEADLARVGLLPSLEAAQSAQSMKALRTVVDAMDAAYMVFWQEYFPLVPTDTPAQRWARSEDESALHYTQVRP